MRRWAVAAVLIPVVVAGAARARGAEPTVRVVRGGEVGDRGRILAHLGGGSMLVADKVESGVSEVDPESAWSAVDAVTPTLRRALAAKDGADLPIILGLVPGSDLDWAVRHVASAGGVVAWVDSSGPAPQVGLVLPASLRAQFAVSLPDLDGRLVFADVQGGARLFNDRSAWLCQSGLTGLTPLFDHGLSGENEIIAVMDTGIDPDSCFFSDEEVGFPAVNDAEGFAVSSGHRKIHAVDFWWDRDWPDPGEFDWDSNGHGTHTAGSAAGDDGTAGVHDGTDGMAPAARLVIQDGGYLTDDCGDLPGLGCPMVPLGPVFEQAWVQGARIHSNSWGDEENIQPFGRYTERTADADRFVWEHPEMVVVAAAGNAGPRDDTVASPSTAKNVVSVGAVGEVFGSLLCPAPFSSRGWSHDGRIKPDVMAPGTGVFSAGTDLRAAGGTCSTVGLSGTSMATPTVAGLAALVRQYFGEGWHRWGRKAPEAGFEPSAALVKATLIASAIDLSTTGCTEADPIPSRDQGWGLVQLDRALWFEGDEHRLEVADEGAVFATAGGSRVYRYRTDREGPLKVVLVWTDPPSSSLASVNLVNDLDLEVIGPSGGLQGNVFDGGESVEGGDADRVNTVEVVRLPEASAGEWVVRVSAASLAEGPQGFALAVVGSLGSRPAARDAAGFGRAGR